MSVFLLVLQIGTSIAINSAKASVNIEKIKKEINWDDQDLYKDADVNLAIAKRIQREIKRKKQLKDEGYSKQQILEIIKKEREQGFQDDKTNIEANNKANENKHNNDDDDENEDNDEDNDFDNDEDNEVDEYDGGFTSTKDGSIFYNKNSQEYKKPIINEQKVGKNTKQSPDKKISKNKSNENINVNVSKKKGEPKKIIIEDDEEAGDEYIYIKKKKKKPKTIVIEEESEDDDYKVVSKKISNNKNNKNGKKKSKSEKKYQNSKNHDNYVNNIQDFNSFSSKYNNIYQNQLTADDIIFLQMLNKTSKNMNNREHFNILARELGKMARNINAEKYNYEDNISINGLNVGNSFFNGNFHKYEKYEPTNIDKDDNYNNDDTNDRSLQDENNYYNSGRFFKNNQQNTKNTKKQNQRIMYASAIGANENKPSSVNSKISENDEIDRENIQMLKQEGDGFLTDKYNRKQIDAKNIGAPYPIMREKKDYISQYNPYNISQVQYDKNNQHLQPAVFEKQIVQDVLAHLKDQNSIEVVKALINKIGKTDIQDDDGNTILMHAVAIKNQSMITMLLSEGANPNAINKDGFSPLHLAATNGDKVAIYYLMIGGGDPNLRDADGNTSLMYASMTCGIDTLRMMISLGGDLTITNKANQNKSVLDYAKLNTDEKVYDFLQNTIERTKGTKSTNLLS